VTLQCNICRRSCAMTKKQYRTLKVWCWNCEEVHCRHRFTVVAQKSLPASCRPRVPWRFPHPPRNCSFGKVEPELEQFAMNARRAPGSILGHHAEDQFSQFFVDSFPTQDSLTARNPFPVQPESDSMPAYDRLWRNDDQGLLPFRPQPLWQEPRTGDQAGRVSASAFAVLRSAAAGAAPDSPTADRIENGKLARTDPAGAEA
jgi:hypothetical protein